MNVSEQRKRFYELHESGTFVMPNPHDVGSAKLLEQLDFSALATTSGGFANALGRLDLSTSRNELVHHVTQLAESLMVPLNVDAERWCPKSPGGISQTVSELADAGASGVSLEDWDPATEKITELEASVAAVREAAEAAQSFGIVLTARAENHLHGVSDIEDTIERLCAYRDAGAQCLYAPGLADLTQIAKDVDETKAPLNVLLLPGGPTVAELAAVGVRRISIGSWFAHIAYGSLYHAAKELRDAGTLSIDAHYLSHESSQAAFTPRVVR